MLTRQALEPLRALRTLFSRHAARRKLAQLRALQRLPLRDPAAIRAYHELLLFIAAHPDRLSVHRVAEAELARLAATTRRLVATSRTAALRLADSGIAGTTTRCEYSFDALVWLAHRFPNDAELDWDEGSLGPAFDEFLPQLACRVEADALLTDRWTTRQWFTAARGRTHGTDLAWLLREFGRVVPAGPLRDTVFDSLQLTIRWTLAPAASRTLCRFPPRPIYCHADGLQRGEPPADVVRKPLKGIAPLSPPRAQALIDAGQAALLARHRETDPMTYAHRREVYYFRLDRGIDVAVFGMLPDRRLPIESFFGFVAAKNRIPAAYGGGWVFADRAEIGVNVFDTLRGGESALLFAQVLRVYRTLFPIREFRVDPYQFGADNPEAIRSGAFWFYYRFGFRPTERRLRELADAEAARIAADRTYRSPAAVLRRLAKSTMTWPLAGAAASAPDLHHLAHAVTRHIADAFAGDRGRAESASLAHVRRILQVRSMSTWPRDQQRAFAHLSVLVAAIPDLPTWPAAQKRALLQVMRAKGGLLERTYVRLLSRHARLIHSLEALCTAAAPQADPP